MPQSSTPVVDYTFYVSGMTCGVCSGTITEYLNTQLGDKVASEFRTDITTPDPKIAKITLKEDAFNDATWTEIKNLIEDIGYDCKDYDYSLDQKDNQYLSLPSDTELPTSFEEIIEKFLSSHWFMGGLGCGAGIAVLVSCMVGLPFPAMLLIACLSTILTVVIGAHSYRDAWSKWIKSSTLTMDTLFALSTTIILVVSTIALFVPWLPMMFDAALLIYGFRHIGIAIKETIKERMGTAKFQDKVPKQIRRCLNDKIEDIDIENIEPGDIIEIQPGEIIPLDGICETDCSICDTIITGSTIPHYYRKGTRVLAGMYLAEHSLESLKIHVKKNYNDSYLAQLDEELTEAILKKAPIEEQTEDYLSRYFIPAIIVIAGLSGLIVSLVYNPALAIHTAISVLVSACPCTLGLITPLAVKAGMHKAAEHGVHFKSAEILQQAEQVDKVIFDLNGTLTQGTPEVTQLKQIYTPKDLSEDKLLAICAALEENSTHLIGRTIYSYAHSFNPEKLIVEHLDQPHHAGVIGKIGNHIYSLGSRTLMEYKNIPLNNVRLPDNGEQYIFLARDQKIIAYLTIRDPLRKDAVRTIQALKAMGKEIHLCTGADKKIAQLYADELDIQHVYAGCDPFKKKDYIESLEGNITMVGDGANDALAVTASHFSIAIASNGSHEVTQKAAGAVINTDALLPIAAAFAISQQTVANIRQNLIMSLIYNLVTVGISSGLLLTLGITINPVVGVALMIVQACLVMLNVFYFKEQPLSHLEESPETFDEDNTEDAYQLMNRKMAANTYQQSLDEEPKAAYNNLFQPYQPSSGMSIQPNCNSAVRSACY